MINSRTQLEIELAKQLQNVQGREFTVQNPRFLSIEELKVQMPKLYRELSVSNFTEDVHAVVIDLVFKGEPETGMILVRRLENGFWKVIGIGD